MQFDKSLSPFFFLRKHSLNYSSSEWWLEPMIEWVWMKEDFKKLISRNLSYHLMNLIFRLLRICLTLLYCICMMVALMKHQAWFNEPVYQKVQTFLFAFCFLWLPGNCFGMLSVAFLWPFRVHSVSIPYSFPVYSLPIPCPFPVHSLSIPCSFTSIPCPFRVLFVSIPGPFCVHSLSMLCLFCVYSVSILCLFCVHSVSILCPFSVHSVSILCPFLVHSLSILCPFRVHSVSIPCPFRVHSVASLLEKGNRKPAEQFPESRKGKEWALTRPCLPTGYAPSNWKVYVSGWGMTRKIPTPIITDKLQALSLNLLSNHLYYCDERNHHTICAIAPLGRMPCVGDSGQWVLILYDN